MAEGAPSVERTRHERGRRAGETTLAQTFRFGSGISAEVVGDVLRSAPLVGADSIFGERPGREESGDADAEQQGRRLCGFSPAPGFRFDVALDEREPGVFVVSFAQPDRTTPYLAGDAVWLVSDGPDAASGALFDEEINTERARSLGAAHLTGPKPSLRRWLFFRIGHAQVMRDATSRIAELAGAR